MKVTIQILADHLDADDITGLDLFEPLIQFCSFIYMLMRANLRF